MPGLIQSWDLTVLSCLRACHEPAAIWAAWVIASLAWKGIVWWILALALWLRGHRLIAAQLVFALLFASAEAASLKGFVLRPRPDLYASQQLNIPMPELLSTTHSFPSGHTTLAAACAAVVAIRYQGWRAWASLAFVFLCGVARIFQGMHWPSDVLGSVVLGVVAGLLALKVSSWPAVKRLTDKRSRPSFERPAIAAETVAAGPANREAVLK